MDRQALKGVKDGGSQMRLATALAPTNQHARALSVQNQGRLDAGCPTLADTTCDLDATRRE